MTIQDSGSELNVISTKLCNKLGLTGLPIVVNTIGVAANVTPICTKMVDLTVDDRMGVQTSMECIVLDKACGKALEIDPVIFETLEKFIIPEDIVVTGGDVELLIGMNRPCLHQQVSMYGNPDSIMIMETRFGPCLIGRAPENFTGNYECGIINVGRMSLEKVEDNNLWKIAEAETAGIKNDCDCNKKSDEDILFDSCMNDAWSFDKKIADLN